MTLGGLTPSEVEEVQMHYLRAWLGRQRRAAFTKRQRWQHGTHYGYRRGCRCRRCEASWRSRETLYNDRERLRYARLTRMAKGAA
jgi:hypothetical protein